MRSSKIITTSIILLLFLGVIFVFDASAAEAYQQFNDKYYFAKQQALWVIIGLGILFMSSVFPQKILKLAGGVVFYVSLVLLFLVLFPGIGSTVQGARRWLVFGGFRFQPSELMKISLIVYFSSWLSKHQRLGPFLFIVGLIFSLLLLEPDLGTALVIGAIAVSLYIGAGGKWRYVSVIASIGMMSVAFLILISPYRKQRLMSYLNPDSDPLGASYHIRQITIALGSGGWTGQGIGKSRQKYQYIPEASTDSIFAITAEEFGFLGSLGVICLFLVVILHGFSIAERAENEYDRLMSLGITMWISAQTIINLGSITALIPLTGVPLPYISYGGSSMLTVLAGSGILIGIGRKHT